MQTTNFTSTAAIGSMRPAIEFMATCYLPKDIPEEPPHRDDLGHDGDEAAPAAARTRA